MGESIKIIFLLATETGTTEKALGEISVAVLLIVFIPILNAFCFIEHEKIPESSIFGHFRLTDY